MENDQLGHTLPGTFCKSFILYPIRTLLNPKVHIYYQMMGGSACFSYGMTTVINLLSLHFTPIHLFVWYMKVSDWTWHVSLQLGLWPGTPVTQLTSMVPHSMATFFSAVDMNLGECHFHSLLNLSLILSWFYLPVKILHVSAMNKNAYSLDFRRPLWSKCFSDFLLSSGGPIPPMQGHWAVWMWKLCIC